MSYHIKDLCQEIMDPETGPRTMPALVIKISLTHNLMRK